ncbi:hypothetical protein INR49_021091 [Caranx melampygus]|nr:hypothetical protein INR49_021091 [Caranx melampygus]
MKEAMMTKAADFAGRPQDMFVSDLTQNRMVLAGYGPSWKQHRCFTLMTLRNFGQGKQSMEQRILGEIQFTVETLERSIGTNLSPGIMFHHTASNTICQVLFAACTTTTMTSSKWLFSARKLQDSKQAQGYELGAVSLGRGG